MLQGPYITNTYGNGIQCQGATMNVTPYLTGTGNFKRPFEHTYMDPVYDMSDLDDDGVLDNPGQILYYVPTRTGQQEVYNISGGISATWSRPLDKEAREKCMEAAQTQTELQKQLTANKRLDFELARLKNCGEQNEGWSDVPSPVTILRCMCRCRFGKSPRSSCRSQSYT